MLFVFGIAAQYAARGGLSILLLWLLGHGGEVLWEGIWVIVRHVVGLFVVEEEVLVGIVGSS